jgi:hypothetical protein
MCRLVAANHLTNIRTGRVKGKESNSAQAPPVHKINSRIPEQAPEEKRLS